MQQTYTASIHKEEDLYLASCVEIGTVSQGYSMEKALKNLKEAIKLYLEEFPQNNSTQTFITTFSTELYV